MARTTDIERVRLAAEKNFGVSLSAAQAARVLEIDDTLAEELNDDGELDTAPRDYLSMAIIELLIPGPPTVQDDLIGEHQDRWHWPCFGSSERYTRAFLKAMKAAIRKSAG